MKRISTFLGSAFVLFLCLVSSAAVPQLINFQGVLKNGSGNPVANGSYSVVFTIYDAPTGGINLWTETRSVTTVDGLFAVLLGSTNPLPDSAFNAPNRYLGIAVSPDPEMAQRQPLVSVGYSYRVNSVDGAFGGAITSKVSIGPGHTNTGTNAFVAGENNKARGNYSAVGGGGGPSAVDSNSASGDWSTVSGGRRNIASGIGATVGGGGYDGISGTGGNTARGPGSVVAGGNFNIAAGVSNVIGGGFNNETSNSDATIAGGSFNTVSNLQSTVGGGAGNTASGVRATISGGVDNIASGDRATVGGGQVDSASGSYATVPGGKSNKASGNYSFAAGRRAKANHLGTFVWADSSADADFASTANNQFLIRASGGVGIGTSSPTKKLEVAGSIKGDTVFSSVISSNSPLELQAPAGTTRMFIGDGGNVGIGTASPSEKLTVAGSMEVGTGAGDYQHLRIGGGNSSGFLYGSYPAFGDGIHLGYNYYADAAGVGVIPNTGGGTSRISLGYGSIGLYAGYANFPPLFSGLYINEIGLVGIGTTSPFYRLDVAGQAHATSFPTSSDSRLKKNIEPLTGVLEKIEKIRGVSFDWNETYEKMGRSSGHREIGVIAQDVEKVFPELVSQWGDEKYRGVDYGRMTAVLIEAVKEQQKQIQELKEEISKMKKESHQAQAEN